MQIEEERFVSSVEVFLYLKSFDRANIKQMTMFEYGNGRFKKYFRHSLRRFICEQ